MELQMNGIHKNFKEMKVLKGVDAKAEAKKAVFEYIELFYNRRRTHSSNGYIPPLLLSKAV